MSNIALIAQLLKVAGDENINYEPYDLRQIDVFYGLPPIPIKGISYINAQYTAPRTKLVSSLNGGGVHVDNSNIGGVVELGVMAGSVSGGAIQVMGLLAQPFPIIIEERTSGGSATVVATECRLADTPVWRREARPGIDVYTFTAPLIAIVNGMRLVSE